jgi:hypothetical protein
MLLMDPSLAMSLGPFISPASPHIPAHGPTGQPSVLNVVFQMHVAPIWVENRVVPSSETSIKFKETLPLPQRVATRTGSGRGVLVLSSFKTTFVSSAKKMCPPDVTLIDVMTAKSKNTG